MMDLKASVEAYIRRRKVVEEVKVEVKEEVKGDMKGKMFI